MRNLDPCLGVVLQAQLQCRSSVQSSAASLHPHCSSVSLTPGFPHALTSDSALHDISGDYDLRGVLTDTTNTIRVEEGSSNHPRGLSCVGRFIWQDVRSFPPLSPYSNSKSRVDQVKKWSDRKYWYLFTSMIDGELSAEVIEYAMQSIKPVVICAFSVLPRGIRVLANQQSRLMW